MKAVSLLSGGLDSTIATKIIVDQGIEVIALNFKSPFCLCDCNSKKNCNYMAFEMAKQLNVPLKTIFLGEEYLNIIKKPKYGYGSSTNPCIDCRILKYKIAKDFMIKIGASFIITGEVLGQRPMSQNKKAMELIEKESGLEGLIVRPLCAKVLQESEPEKKKWIDRNKFFDIQGRSRKCQLKLTKEFKIIDYACPSGGCLLTDKNYGEKIKNLIEADMLTMENINFFKIGRFFSISKNFKLIIGRNESENKNIIALVKPQDILLIPKSKGPTGAGRGKFTENEINIAAKILAFYCKDENVKIKIINEIYYKEIEVKNKNKFDSSILKNYKLSFV